MQRLALARIAQQLNYKIEHVSPYICKVHFPGGFPYEAFDYTDGRIKPMALFEIIGATQIYLIWPENSTSFQEFNKVVHGKLWNIGTLNMEIFPEAYQSHLPKFPLVVTNSISYTGRSSNNSIGFTCIVSCPELKTPYAKCKIHTFLVDKTLHKVSVLPDWWTSKYGNIKETGWPLNALHLTRPHACPSHQTTVLPMHCGEHMHMRLQNVLQYCYDTYSLFERKLIYRNIKGESIKKGTKSVTLSFKRKVPAFEMVNVYSWEDENAQNKVCFDIQNSKEETCSQSSIEFYP